MRVVRVHGLLSMFYVPPIRKGRQADRARSELYPNRESRHNGRRCAPSEASVTSLSQLPFEVSLREGSAGAGLQVALEANRSLLVGELDDNVQLPGAVPRGMRTSARVVIVEPTTCVRREADVEAGRRFGVSEDIDDVLISRHAGIGSEPSASNETGHLGQNPSDPPVQMAIFATCARVADGYF
jgi:hypothetical protein